MHVHVYYACILYCTVLLLRQTKSGHDQRHQLYAMTTLLENLPSLEANPDTCQLKKAMASFARACKWCFRPQHATWQAYRAKVVLRAATHLFMCAVDLESVSLTNSKGCALWMGSGL